MTRQPVTSCDDMIRYEPRKWVNKFPQGTWDLDDLIQESEIVFLNCQEKFDSKKGHATFDTYLNISLINRYKSLLNKAWGRQDHEDSYLNETTDVVSEDTASSDIRIGLARGTKLDRRVLTVLADVKGDSEKAAKRLGMTIELVNRFRNRAGRRLGHGVR